MRGYGFLRDLAKDKMKRKDQDKKEVED